VRAPLIVALSSTAVLAACWAGGCLIEGFDTLQGDGGATAVSSSTGAGASGGNGGSGGSACGHRIWPPPPAQSSPGADDVELVVAARSLDFGEQSVNMGALVGLDLDNRCTCQGEGPSCVAPPKARPEFCDGPDGIDNSVSEFFNFLGTFSKNFTSAEYTSEAERGGTSLLVRVRDYNGGADDKQVTLSLHPSPGRDVDPCGGPAQPNWDGNDTWPISSVSLQPLGGGGGGGGAGGAGGGGGAGGAPPPTCGNNGFDPNTPLYVDTNAYVNDWVVVANLPTLALQFVGDDSAVPIALTAGFVMGTLVQQGSRWAMRDGLMVGRWKLAEFFKLIGSITNQSEPICTDTAVYAAIKNAVCEYPDIASTLGGPTTPCDAMSFGLGFQAEPAAFGAVVPQPAASPLCPPATDPQFDNCDDTN
jgi:hypothetical protein